MKNGFETGLDCGGGICGLCPAGEGCLSGADCQSFVCTGWVCQAPTCVDGVKNQDESDLDCGGKTCALCGNGKSCNVGKDCQSKVCVGGICQVPSCFDGACQPAVGETLQSCEADCGAMDVAAGTLHNCAVLGDGTVRCWGWNVNGQLGDGTQNNAGARVAVTGLTNAEAIAVGWSHSCALKDDGTVSCWGLNGNGQLGNGVIGGSYSTPQAVLGLTGAVAIVAGQLFSCALLEDGTIQCWGGGTGGELGNSAYADSAIPVAVTGISTAVAIGSWYRTVCAVLDEGIARCWGINTYGQLGNNTVSPSNVPVGVMGLSGAAAISSGLSHSCAVRSDGTAACWGNDWSGQLGTNNGGDSLVPVNVVALSSASADISIGARHSCVLLNGAQPQCWGANSGGQIGDGSLTNKGAPTAPANLGTVRAISAGESHTCAVLSDGKVSCWGYCSVGVNVGCLGYGATSQLLTPLAGVSMLIP